MRGNRAAEKKKLCVNRINVYFNSMFIQIFLVSERP